LTPQISRNLGGIPDQATYHRKIKFSVRQPAEEKPVPGYRQLRGELAGWRLHRR
jgi:hypothetical protein